MNTDIIELKNLAKEGAWSTVNLVSINGKKYVLKIDSVREIAAQKFFFEQLEKHRIPTLKVYERPDLQPDHMLLEYIEDSPTLGKHLSIESSRKWGTLTSDVHAITFDRFSTLDEEGAQHDDNWREYLKKYIDTATERHIRLQDGLSADLIKRASKILHKLLDYQPSSYSLTHGDLHVHNVLLRDDTLILYDKFADFIMAPAVFDIALLYAEAFSGAAYPELGTSTVEEQEMLAAFLEGYGSLPDEQQPWLDYFILLRAFYRWPNRFTPHSGKVIELLVDKLSQKK